MDSNNRDTKLVTQKGMEVIVGELTFCPSPEHRKVKSAFWAIADETQLVDHSQGIELATALRFTADNRLSRWWPLPGFREWFSNKDEYRQRLEYLANLALDTAEEILIDKKAHPSARANMVKLVIEAANKMPPRQIAKELYIDEKIHRMDRTQLEEFVRKNIKLVSAGSDESK